MKYSSIRIQTSRVWVPWQTPGFLIALLTDRGVSVESGKGATWTDVSTGKGFSASGAAPVRPAFTSSDSNFGGMPTLEFGPGNLYLQGTLPFAISQPSTYYVLGRTAAASPPHIPMQPCETVVPAYWSAASNKVYAGAGSNISTVASIGGSTNYLLTTVFNGANGSVGWSSSAASSSGTGNIGANAAAIGDVLRVGSGSESGAAKYFWNSTIAAVFVGLGAHAPALQARIKTWLAMWSRTTLV